MLDKLWQEQIAEYLQKVEETEHSHPLFQKPNPKCSECNGSGSNPSTSNPDSKWDWYSLPYYEPNYRWRESPEWIKPKTTDQLLVEYEKRNFHYCPWAIVTPDGNWHERGQMGWWAISCGTHGRGDWMDACKVILQKWLNHQTILVDCHI